jgi:multisubunit Na+/H+ antiporter MnhF subunit
MDDVMQAPGIASRLLIIDISYFITACLFIMVGLPYQAWERFGIWLAIGLVLYVTYGFRHSKLRRL